MSLEMRHAYQHIGFCNTGGYPGFFAILPAGYRDDFFIGPFQPVGYDYRSPRHADGVVPVQVRRTQMIHGVGAGTAVKGVGVC